MVNLEETRAQVGTDTPSSNERMTVVLLSSDSTHKTKPELTDGPGTPSNPSRSQPPQQRIIHVVQVAIPREISLLTLRINIHEPSRTIKTPV